MVCIQKKKNLHGSLLKPSVSLSLAESPWALEWPSNTLHVCPNSLSLPLNLSLSLSLSCYLSLFPLKIRLDLFFFFFFAAGPPKWHLLLKSMSKHLTQKIRCVHQAKAVFYTKAVFSFGHICTVCIIASVSFFCLKKHFATL